MLAQQYMLAGRPETLLYTFTIRRETGLSCSDRHVMEGSVILLALILESM